MLFLNGNGNLKFQTTDTCYSDFWKRQFIQIHTCFLMGYIFSFTSLLKYMLLECSAVYIFINRPFFDSAVKLKNNI